MEAAARLVFSYVAIAGLLFVVWLVLSAFRSFKQALDLMNIFIELMIGLYEQQNDKNQREDE